MAVTTYHPKYLEFHPLWLKMKACFKGSDFIKEAGPLYLPVPESMRIDGMEPGQDGAIRYQAYKQRARFPEYVYDAVVNNTGILHRKDPAIQLPSEMEYMLTRASNKGESLLQLLRRINHLQLRDGRVGLVLDLPAGETRDSKPYISLYEACAIRNWDTGEDTLGYESLNLVILDESKYVLDGTAFEWKWQQRYRVLQLGSAEIDEDENAGALYKQRLDINFGTTGDTVPEGEWIYPTYKGQKLQKIPFVFCNAMDLCAEPDRPPFLSLANDCLGIYQGEADYRRCLYMQGEDTLVVKGVVNANSIDPDGPIRVGSGARLDVGQEGDAKYIGVSGEGLAEQRKALETDHSNSASKSGQLTRTDQASQESGDALRTRVAAKTASLVGIAFTGAKALESILKICAEWMGADPSKVSVEPNVDFSKTVMLGQDFVQIMTGRGMGAPLSLQSIHDWLKDNSMSVHSFEEEMQLIENELEKYKFLEKLNAKADMNGTQQVSNDANKAQGKDS